MPHTQRKDFNYPNQNTTLLSRIKFIVVTMALWGLIPIWLADWIIQHGGMSDE